MGPIDETATKLHNWYGLCIGDGASTRFRSTTRIVAFQSAGRACDIRAWATQSATNMRTTGAHIGIYTETRIYGTDRHTLVVNTFLAHGFLAISYNALPSDKRRDIQEDDEQQGPKAAGVVLAVCARYAGGWTDINKDEDGRAISANIILDDDTTARINVVYGVSGASSPNFTSFRHKELGRSLT